MRQPDGWILVTEPGKKDIEIDTIMCGHCNSVAYIKPGQQGLGKCRMCMRNLCEQCGGLGSCSPFEKQLEAMERADKLMRACKE